MSNSQNAGKMLIFPWWGAKDNHMKMISTAVYHISHHHSNNDFPTHAVSAWTAMWKPPSANQNASDHDCEAMRNGLCHAAKEETWSWWLKDKGSLPFFVVTSIFTIIDWVYFLTCLTPYLSFLFNWKFSIFVDRLCMHRCTKTSFPLSFLGKSSFWPSENSW